eukprot:CAMPEP_0177651418 /NCGR_PEP_ID=MMETSP0447-20121125/12537_1 /TAXON_ID=0 /ORGANISM="Stygamoeba regulata, Strain BSH-02190019" /LENGTH=164 /DNA_ID=CAMNT_0019154497 /DNA_START=316 /DNA_END=810 /DNA_ORIENTATION=-
MVATDAAKPGARKDSSIPFCADFQKGLCSRPECKFLHVKELCGDFLKGRCTRGEACRFTHQYAYTPDTNIICKDYQRGSCHRAKDCRYAHLVDPGACRDFQRGQCARGQLCRFRHIAPTGQIVQTQVAVSTLDDSEAKSVGGKRKAEGPADDSNKKHKVEGEDE